MTTFSSFPSIFVPLVGLVFPAIAMASLSLYVQKTKIFQIRWGQDQILSIFFQDLDVMDTYLVEYCITSGLPEPNRNEKAPLMHT